MDDHVFPSLPMCGIMAAVTPTMDGKYMRMSSVLLVVLVPVAAAQVVAQAPSPAPVPPVRPPYGAPVTLAQARAIVAGAEAEARRNGWRMAVAIVEPTGDLVLFERLDDTQYGSIQIAQAKARAAALYRRATKEMSDAVQGGGAGLAMLTAPGSIALAGGLPRVIDGKIAGALGVSGGSAEQDAQAAAAGRTAAK
jgi:glc operon protein GlcG